MGTNRRARRLRTLDGKRLGVVVCRPGGSTALQKSETEQLLASIAQEVGKSYNLAATPIWRKPRSTPIVRPVIEEIAATCDAIVMGIGDCRHGSSFSLADVFELEGRGVRVAYIDTPCRIPRVHRNAGAFVIEYGFIEKWARRWDPEEPTQRSRLEYEFHTQGITRALRVAGCKPGDVVRLDGRELVAWKRLLTTEIGFPDGIRDYEYIVTEPLRKNKPGDITRRVQELAPRVVEMLTT